MVRHADIEMVVKKEEIDIQIPRSACHAMWGHMRKDQIGRRQRGKGEKARPRDFGVLEERNE